MTALREAANNPDAGLAVLPKGPAPRIELWDATSFAAALKPSLNPSEWFFNINVPEDWLQAQHLRVK